MKKTLLLTFILFLGILTTVRSQQCNSTFTDPAGPNTNYANASDYTVTFCPNVPGEVVTVTFTTFNTETNYDALYVFNGNTINATQIPSNNPAGNVPGGLAGGFWGTTIPGPFTSTSADGCLTFRFRSDGSVNNPGWVANVTCAPPPQVCAMPTTLSVSNITTSSVNLNWALNSTATQWETLILPAGSPAPTANSSGTVTQVNPTIITSLSPNTCYTYYVRTICSETLTSNWSGGFNFCTLPAPPVCGGNFIDTGGIAGNYAGNSDVTTIICPSTPGDVVTVTFTSFDTEATWDGLYVYNGNAVVPANIIASANPAANVPGGIPGSYWGTTIPGPFTSTSTDGCLTFRFRSDGAVQNAGWVANVTCALPPSCRVPTTLTSSSITSTSVVLNWSQTANPNNSLASSWEYLILPNGSPIPNSNTSGFLVATSNPITINGLTPITCYTFYVRAVCSTTDKSAWSNGLNFCTLINPPVCGGQFYDNGGPNANYSNNADITTTICPTNPGDIVTVVFSSFTTEVNFDALYVFNGNSITAPQIASTNAAGNVPGGQGGGFWGTTIPGPFTSTSPDGCLTFRFRSDGSVTPSGWVANVFCAPDADKIILVAFVDANSNGIKDNGEALFPNGSFLYQQNNNGTDVIGYSPFGQFALYDTNPANTYNFSYQIQPEYAAYYNSGTTSYTNMSIPVGSGTQFLYFPVTLTQSFNDVTVSIAPLNVPRPGFTYVNKITYKNIGVAATGGTITFVKPPQITTLTVSQAGTATNTTGFTYNFTNLLPNETRTFNVTMTVPLVPLVNINELLTATVSISAPANDINLTNNSNSNTQIVVNSFDPNDKMESRGKTIPFNQFTQDDYFIYTIRFQNLGTADAIDVRIEDVLNAKIDETSVLMVSSSHNYTLKRINNLLVWDFKNIYLSPAILNDAGSKGYVQFMVKLKPGFQAGDIIPNNASIYFDSNPAIVTATFNSKFTVPLGITTFDDNSLVLYPNPANNLVQIDLINTNEQVKSIVIYDMLGKEVKTIAVTTTSSLSVDVSDVSKGMYLVEITSESNLKVTKKLMVQ